MTYTRPPEPSGIEERLMVVAEMLERAVAEVRRAMAEVQGNVTEPPPPNQKEG